MTARRSGSRSSTTTRPTARTLAGRAARVNDLDAHVGFWLRFVSNHVSARFRRNVEAEGVTVSEWVVLRHVFRTGEATPSGLVVAMGMTKGAISKILTNLQHKGLLERETTAADQRAHALRLTPRGDAIVPALARLADENDALFFGHLTQARRRALIRTMQQVVERHQLSHQPTE